MDEESYVTSQTILSLLKFIREGNGIASEGPIFYPLKFESANFLTATAELEDHLHAIIVHSL